MPDLTPVPGGRGPNGSLASWQRPPFQTGHTVNLKHGARHERSIQPLAREIIDDALAQCEYLNDPSFQPALLAWARTEAKIELLHRYLDDHGLIDQETGKVRNAANLLTKLETQASNQRSKLGMDPLSRAKLRRETAATEVDLATVMAQIKDTKHGA